MFGLPQGMEIVVLLVVVLLLFGGSRLAGMGKGAGRAIREFKDEVKGDEVVDKRAAEALDAPRTKVTESVSDRVAQTDPVVRDNPAPEQRARDI